MVRWCVTRGPVQREGERDATGTRTHVAEIDEGAGRVPKEAVDDGEAQDVLRDDRRGRYEYDEASAHHPVVLLPLPRRQVPLVRRRSGHVRPSAGDWRAQGGCKELCPLLAGRQPLLARARVVRKKDERLMINETPRRDLVRSVVLERWSVRSPVPPPFMRHSLEPLQRKDEREERHFRESVSSRRELVELVGHQQRPPARRRGEALLGRARNEHLPASASVLGVMCCGLSPWRNQRERGQLTKAVALNCCLPIE